MESSEKVGELKVKLQEAAELSKCCSICRTTKTPLWRSGPSGPKSLCNACGIRFRKKRGSEVKSKTSMGKTRKGRNLKVREGLVMVPLRAGKGSPRRRRRSPGEWGEVERAALLLMALSCGAVFA